MPDSPAPKGKYVSIDGIDTHYLEAGERFKGNGPSVLLLHSAEFGGAAELSWEFNIGPIGEHFHVIAPDHLGFGRTDKVFDFCGQFPRRIRHIARFVETMGVRQVHVVGSSMSGGLSLAVAARPKPDWPIAKVVACSGGGDAPDNESRKILNSYDGSPEHMRRIVAVMFVDPKWARDDAYIAHRQELATLPGAWEATQAARFKAPFRKPAADRGERDAIRYDNIKMPCLIMAGRLDPLRSPGYADKLAAAIPGAELHVFQNASHMANIECAAEFNDRLLRFLKA